MLLLSVLRIFLDVRIDDEILAQHEGYSAANSGRNNEADSEKLYYDYNRGHRHVHHSHQSGGNSCSNQHPRISQTQHSRSDSASQSTH